MSPEVVAIGAGLVALHAHHEAYRRTSHGENPWTVEGFVGVSWISGYVDAVCRLTGASSSSIYRAPQVQAAVYEAKRKSAAQWAVVEASAKKAGMTADAYVAMLLKRGRHMRGLAGDFDKPGTTTAQLAAEIFEHAKAGRIGPVKKILDERDHAHVEWLAPWESVRSPVLEGV